MAPRTRLFDAELHRDLSGGLETDATISRVALTASKSCPRTRTERFIQTGLREWADARGYQREMPTAGDSGFGQAASSAGRRNIRGRSKVRGALTERQPSWPHLAAMLDDMRR